MRIREQHTAFRQTIEMRGLGIGITETAHIPVQIINRDEEHVHPIRRTNTCRQEPQQTSYDNTYAVDFLGARQTFTKLHTPFIAPIPIL